MKEKNCKNPECDNKFTPRFSSVEMYCSGKCAATSKTKLKQTPIKRSNTKINPRSKKRIALDALYNVEAKLFRKKPENLFCPVTGKPTTEVHHKMGRIGFADDWARENNIPLLMDKRFWLALSHEGHRQIEENPNWAKENGYSLNRL